MTPHIAREWSDPLADIDARSPEAMSRLFHDAADANFSASCRRGSIDFIPARGTLLATGDLHDNPSHFARVVEMAGLPGAEEKRPHHLTLHEVIHSHRLVGGVDLSHRALARVAALKVKDPEEVHTLLANHELSQIVGAGIVKDGVRVVDAFNAGVEYVYGDDAPQVLDAIAAFIRSMPLALITESPPSNGASGGAGNGASGSGPSGGGGGGVLCAHSLPGPEVMDRFDPAILERDLVEADYEPRRGSAHLMVWGRRHRPEQLQMLADRWGVRLFILGHEHAESGWSLLPPNTIILNSDHAAGVALSLDLSRPPTLEEAETLVTPLGVDAAV